MNVVILVKNSDQKWEVARGYSLPPKIFDPFMKAYESEYPISGMITSEHKEKVLRGAKWNGESFSGSNEGIIPWDPDTDWSATSTYSIISNNTILVTFINTNNDSTYDKMQAIFLSEVTMVPVRVDQLVRIGYTWDGQNFIENS